MLTLWWKEKNMSTLHIFRGLPGSGKSTAARKLGLAHYEADMFFEDYQGRYCFEPERLEDAHKWCQNKVREALRAGKDVSVANTFLRVWQVENYVGIAEQAGAKVCIYECTGNFGSIHGVPDEEVARMREQWEELPEKLWHLLVQ